MCPCCVPSNCNCPTARARWPCVHRHQNQTCPMIAALAQQNAMKRCKLEIVAHLEFQSFHVTDQHIVFSTASASFLCQHKLRKTHVMHQSCSFKAQASVDFVVAVSRPADLAPAVNSAMQGHALRAARAGGGGCKHLLGSAPTTHPVMRQNPRAESLRSPHLAGIQKHPKFGCYPSQKNRVGMGKECWHTVARRLYATVQ